MMEYRNEENNSGCVDQREVCESTLENNGGGADQCENCESTFDCGAPLTGVCLHDRPCGMHAHWARIKEDCGCGIVGPCPVIGLCGAHRSRDGLLAQQQGAWANASASALCMPPHRVRATLDNLSRGLNEVYTCLTRALRAHDLPIYCTADVPLWILEDGNKLLRHLNYYIKPTLNNELARVQDGQFIVYFRNKGDYETLGDILYHFEAIKKERWRNLSASR